eukprot:TRINITY_DN21691_c0_g1_i1.p1 TRINITY_DN21691_c0_g1~~TRINITY_DN21691_c0_g1_i1.p1  ORF type:complete len:192 (+),score=33.07 TRINITY_DN21691_c0_g1_i1:91-666(+)
MDCAEYRHFVKLCKTVENINQDIIAKKQSLIDQYISTPADTRNDVALQKVADFKRRARENISCAAYGEAATDYKSALEILATILDYGAIAQVQGSLASVYLLMKHVQESLELYDHAIATARQLSPRDPNVDAHLLYNKAFALRDSGRLPEALSHMRDAKRLLQHLEPSQQNHDRIELIQQNIQCLKQYACQ